MRKKSTLIRLNLCPTENCIDIDKCYNTLYENKTEVAAEVEPDRSSETGALVGGVGVAAV